MTGQNSIKFFADTANVDEIRDLFGIGVNDGITTNPMIMQTTGDLTQGFEHACRTITGNYSHVPVSLETDLRGIAVGRLEELSSQVREVLMAQANDLARFGDNVVVKIPVCSGGLEAVRELTARGVKTNVTACMTPYQALEAARAGATYVSLFANRMLDATILALAGYNLPQLPHDSNWKSALGANKDRLYEEAWAVVLDNIAYVAQRLEGSSSSLIVGSIRSPEDIRRLVRAGPQIITIPTKIAKQLESEIPSLKMAGRSLTVARMDEGAAEIYHPMTHYTIEEFEKAADSYRK